MHCEFKRFSEPEQAKQLVSYSYEQVAHGEGVHPYIQFPARGPEHFK